MTSLLLDYSRSCATAFALVLLKDQSLRLFQPHRRRLLSSTAWVRLVWSSGCVVSLLAPPLIRQGMTTTRRRQCSNSNIGIVGVSGLASRNSRRNAWC